MPRANRIPKKISLGGTVYAEFDGHNIILTTDTERRIYGPTNLITLEPDVMEKLIKYSKITQDLKLYCEKCAVECPPAFRLA